jgi:fatty-acyl-CoA synthase
LRFIGTDGRERFYDFDEVRREVAHRASHLTSHGLRPGDRLAMATPDGHEFVLSFLAAVIAGIVPVPIYATAAFKRLDAYVDSVAHVARAARARGLLSSKSMDVPMAMVKDRVPGLELSLVTETAFSGPAPRFQPPRIGPETVCFLQFTSGSTSRPKGVMVTHANLIANAEACLGPHGLAIHDCDVTVSWLPLYHDMGLGFVFSAIIGDLPAVFLPTSSFARTPFVWLEALHRHRGTITYAPNFAYQLVAKRLREGDRARLDLSHVRVAGCGAEPIRAKALLEFARVLRPTGFDGDRVLLPCYGMAEATLAITFHQLGQPILCERVDAEALQRGEARCARATDAHALELVSCGRPFPGHELIIAGEEGERLGERRVGEILVRGPSVTAGYCNDEGATAETWVDGWLHTGDLGYLAGGNLFVCGRKKDLIIINGANHYPQDIEWAVSEIEDVRRGNVVAFSVSRDGLEDLIVVAEGPSSRAAALRATITERIAEDLGLQARRVYIVPAGALPRTSSGKPQRGKTRQMIETGELVAYS